MLRKIEKKENAPSSPKPTFHIEGEGALRGSSFFFSNVSAVGELSEERIELIFKRGRIELVGKRLRLSLYERKCVQIKGVVESIFIKGKAEAHI